MTDLSRELQEIGSLITSTMFLAAIRREVSAVRKDGFVVTDGKRAGAKDYDVVVRSEDSSEDICRRIRSKMPNIDIERLADGVLGIRETRRGGNTNG